MASEKRNARANPPTPLTCGFSLPRQKCPTVWKGGATEMSHSRTTGSGIIGVLVHHAMKEPLVTSSATSPAELIAAYLRGPGLLRDAVAGLDAVAVRARPIPGKMSSLEVACHIVDSDQFMCDRMKRTIATNRPLLMGVESASYPVPLCYHERDLELDLHLLEVQRAQMAADLRRLPGDAWYRTAEHSENGTQTLLEIFLHAVEHLDDHIVAIAEKRAALGL